MENKPTKSKSLESDIVRGICEYLESQKYFFWRSNNVPVFARSNDGVKRFRAMPKYTPKGLPDIMLIDQGKFIVFEVKRPGAKQTPEQIYIETKMTLSGAHYFVVTSPDEVEEAILSL